MGIQIEGFKIQNASHINDFNRNLISVREICDTMKIVIFLEDEAAFLNTPKIEANESRIVVSVPRTTEDGF